MPYDTIDDLPDSVKALPKEAQELFLNVVNYGLIHEGYDEETAFRTAWSVIKKKWKKEGDKWVKKTSAAIDPLIIEGPVFPIGKKNANGWGVPESEVENAIKTLKTAVVRVCTREDEHACDVTEDPFSEIGRVVDAWREDGYVKTKVAITDRQAKQKIEDGVWEHNWSVYGHAKEIKDGWAHGINIKSLTLVRFPAWDEAYFSIVSASHDSIAFSLSLKSLNDYKNTMTEDLEAAEWTTQYINDLPDSAFAYIEPCYKQGKTDNKNARHLPYKDKNGKIDLPHLRNALARVSQIKPICPDTNREEMIRKARAVLEKAAKQAEIGKYRDNKNKTKASKEDEMDNKEKVEEFELQTDVTASEQVYTKAQVDELLKAAVEQARRDTIEELKREQLATEISKLLVKAGIIKDEDADNRTKLLKEIEGTKLEILKADVEKMAEKLTELRAATKDVEVSIPAEDTGAAAGLTVGMFKDGKWIGGEQ